MKWRHFFRVGVGVGDGVCVCVYLMSCSDLNEWSYQCDSPWNRRLPWLGQMNYGLDTDLIGNSIIPVAQPLNHVYIVYQLSDRYKML